MSEQPPDLVDWRHIVDNSHPHYDLRHSTNWICVDCGFHNTYWSPLTGCYKCDEESDNEQG